jgi:hypothetical protein
MPNARQFWRRWRLRRPRRRLPPLPQQTQPVAGGAVDEEAGEAVAAAVAVAVVAAQRRPILSLG